MIKKATQTQNLRGGNEMTNYGNGYKFTALNKRHSNPTMVTVQRETKSGWGKPYETEVLGNETPEQVVERLIKNNNKMFRLVK